MSVYTRLPSGRRGKKDGTTTVFINNVRPCVYGPNRRRSRYVVEGSGVAVVSSSSSSSSEAGHPLFTMTIIIIMYIKSTTTGVAPNTKGDGRTKTGAPLLRCCTCT